MNEGEFAQNLQRLKPGLRARFYERLSSLCYSELRQNYLSVSHKVVFLFLLSLCAEITLCLNAPVLRSMRINFPPAVILNTTDYNAKPRFFQQNPAYKNSAYFLSALPSSILAPAQLYNRVILYNKNIPISLPIAVFNIFILLTYLLIRDDRIIANTKIKLSPITAQGPPFIEYFSTINASRIRTPYLCCLSVSIYNYRKSDFCNALSSLLSWPQFHLQSSLDPDKTKLKYFTLTKGGHHNYQNSCLYFSQVPLVSMASRTGETIFLYPLTSFGDNSHYYFSYTTWAWKNNVLIKEEVRKLKIKPG